MCCEVKERYLVSTYEKQPLAFTVHTPLSYTLGRGEGGSAAGQGSPEAVVVGQVGDIPPGDEEGRGGESVVPPSPPYPRGRAAVAGVRGEREGGETGLRRACLLDDGPCEGIALGLR